LAFGRFSYTDSGMPGSSDNRHPQALFAAPLEKVVADVVTSIRQIRPQVVITFDPIGGYRHPDHITIQRATVKAFAAAGDAEAYPDGLPAYAPQRLYFHTISKRFLRLVVRLLPLVGRNPHEFGKNKDIDLASLVSEDFPVNAVIDYRPVAKAREAASRCHASQGGAAMTQGIQGWVMRWTGAKDTFTQSYPEPDGQKVTHDLFAGVDVQK
jgi:LmbE family N-acetylglucosaminyl deacetylase